MVWSNPWAIYFYVNTHTCICAEFGISLSGFSGTIVSNFVSYVCPASRQAVWFWSSNAGLYCLNIPAQWLRLILWYTHTMAGSIWTPTQWQGLILVRGLSRKCEQQWVLLAQWLADSLIAVQASLPRNNIFVSSVYILNCDQNIRPQHTMSDWNK